MVCGETLPESGGRPAATDWHGGWPQDAAGFEPLVGCFQDRLVGYAFRRLGNLADAEDVVQDVFVRAFAAAANRLPARPPGAPFV